MILTFIEQNNDKIESAAQQTLTFAHQLANEMNTSVESVLIGGETDSIVEALKNFGVSKVHSVKHEKLDSYAPQAWANSLIQLAEEIKAEAIISPSTERGNEVMAYVGVKLSLPMATNCCKIEPGNQWKIMRQRWGGGLLEESVLSGTPKLLTIAQHIIEAEKSPVEENEVKEFNPTLEDKDFRIRVVREERSAEEGLDLKTASLVIGGGRGVGSADGFKVLEELADQLGGIVGGSRVTTNNGWRPHTHQIGLTGNRIAPKLYIACGISGAIQHLVGCKGAKNILVINNDKDAPFFSQADYGVIGDLHEVVPAIIEEIKSSR